MLFLKLVDWKNEYREISSSEQDFVKLHLNNKNFNLPALQVFCKINPFMASRRKSGNCVLVFLESKNEPLLCVGILWVNTCGSVFVTEVDVHACSATTTIFSRGSTVFFFLECEN